MLNRCAILLLCLCMLYGCVAPDLRAAYAAPRQAEAPQLPMYTTEEEFAKQLHQKLISRATEFQIAYQGDAQDLYGTDMSELFDAAWETDQPTSDDFDYLRFNVKDYALQADTVAEKTVFTFHLSYRESAEQLRRVNPAVGKALKQLRLAQDSDAVKTMKIHDWIIRRVARAKNEDKDSAFDAMVDKSASSRGYALLTYKMLTEAGVPCRIVMGEVGGARHFWNMVRLDAQWYYLDNALDDGDSSVVPVRYNYFLIGSKTLRKDHKRSEAYQMAEFEGNHPVSSADYKGRKDLILAADAARVEAKSGGVGPFNEAYDTLSNQTVDPFESLNDQLTNGALDALERVFDGL